MSAVDCEDPQSLHCYSSHTRCHALLRVPAACRAAAAKGVLEGGLALGRWAAGVRGPLLTAARSARLARILDGGETLRLQYPREDLGFTYASPGAAVCPEEPAAARGTATGPGDSGDQAAQTAPDRAAPYVPSTAPGARLPHAAVTLHSPGARPFGAPCRPASASTWQPTIRLGSGSGTGFG